MFVSWDSRSSMRDYILSLVDETQSSYKQGVKSIGQDFNQDPQATLFMLSLSGQTLVETPRKTLGWILFEETLCPSCEGFR